MKHRLLKLFIFLLLASPAGFAQGTFSFQQIEAALEDHLYSLVDEQIWGALSTRRSVEEETDLTLLLIRSLIGQTHFDDAVILADESHRLPQQDAFAYWKARALFEAKQFDALFKTLEEDKKLLSTGLYAPAALRMKGRAEQLTGKLKAAESSLAHFRKVFPEEDAADQNLLDLAIIQRERGHRRTAKKTAKELLKRFPDSPLTHSARLLLARELIAGGSKKEVAEAAALLRQLGATETSLPRLRITAWTELAALEQRAGHASVAGEALLNAEALTAETTLRIHQQTTRSKLLITEGKPDEALVLFDKAIETAPDEALAANILLQKAEALLNIGRFEHAEKAFQACLNVTDDPDGEARALNGKGWSLWEQSRYEEAAAAFENAATKDNDPDRAATAWVKAGDARLAAEQYANAFKNYQVVVTEFREHTLAPRAIYQSGVARRAAGNPEDAYFYFQTVETRFPDSTFAPHAALQLAELLKSEEDWAAALQEYVRIASQYTQATHQATALHQQGLLRFGLDRFADALENFRTVSETYPDSPEAPQAVYMQGFCRYLQGDIDAALKICRTFIEAYPDSLWTPEVLFWLAEHAYNRGDYPHAYTTFLDIAERFPENELGDDALFWAGNSLLQQDSYLDAFTLYSRLAKKYPQSGLLLETRFAQGEVLTELGEFPRAILAYEEVIKTAPDDPLTDRARGRLGDCLFTLGSKETPRYQEAIRAYQALYKRPATSFALKLQALYKIARCEDKMQHADKAFTHYMEAVYTAGSHPEPLSPEAVLWFTRAALDAATSQERQNHWVEAVQIYERIIQAGVPAQDEAAKRIEQLKQEHAEAFGTGDEQ